MKKVLITRRLIRESEDKASKLFDAKFNTNDELYSQKKLIEMSEGCDGILSSLTEKLANLGASQIVKLIKELDISPIINSKKQDHSKATIAPKMTKEDGLIDWEKSFNEINDLIRGCNPWPVAYTKLDKSMIKIYEVTQNNSEKIPPGVIKKVNGSMVVGCKDKNIEIL